MTSLILEPTSIMGKWTVVLSACSAKATSSPCLIRAGAKIHIYGDPGQPEILVDGHRMIVSAVEVNGGYPTGVVFAHATTTNELILCNASACAAGTARLFHGMSTVGDPDTAAVWAAEQSG